MMARTYSLQPSLAEDGLGLPVVSFFGHEGVLGLAERRTVRIVEDGAGHPFIEVSAPWALRGPSRVWLPPLVAVLVFVGLGALLQDVIGLRPYDVMGTIWFDVVRGFLLVCALVAAVVVVRLDQGRRLGRVHQAPWAILQSFVVSDSTTLYGDGSKEDAQRLRAHVLRAELGAAAYGFEVVSTRAQQTDVAALHALLTTEFIESRAKHLQKLAARRRKAEGGPAEARAKVI